MSVDLDSVSDAVLLNELVSRMRPRDDDTKCVMHAHVLDTLITVETVRSRGLRVGRTEVKHYDEPRGDEA
jgi:hypothetical protein